MAAYCIVCGSAREDRVERTVSRTFGDGTQLLAIKLPYCADDARCGEERALRTIDLMAAPFNLADYESNGGELDNISQTPP
jgi:hypothetical protein